jgi:hypothetical protein
MLSVPVFSTLLPHTVHMPHKKIICKQNQVAWWTIYGKPTKPWMSEYWHFFERMKGRKDIWIHTRYPMRNALQESRDNNYCRRRTQCSSCPVEELGIHRVIPIHSQSQSKILETKGGIRNDLFCLNRVCKGSLQSRLGCEYWTHPFWNLQHPHLVHGLHTATSLFTSLWVPRQGAE